MRSDVHARQIERDPGQPLPKAFGPSQPIEAKPGLEAGFLKDVVDVDGIEREAAADGPRQGQAEQQELGESLVIMTPGPGDKICDRIIHVHMIVAVKT
jgi:hypothetical protein